MSDGVHETLFEQAKQGGIQRDETGKTKNTT